MLKGGNGHNFQHSQQRIIKLTGLLLALLKRRFLLQSNSEHFHLSNFMGDFSAKNSKNNCMNQSNGWKMIEGKNILYVTRPTIFPSSCWGIL